MLLIDNNFISRVSGFNVNANALDVASNTDPAVPSPYARTFRSWNRAGTEEGISLSGASWWDLITKS